MQEESAAEEHPKIERKVSTVSKNRASFLGKKPPVAFRYTRGYSRHPVTTRLLSRGNYDDNITCSLSVVSAVPAFDYSRITEPRGSVQLPFHPFLCRIKDSEGFCVTSFDSLIGAGFASLALALFTLFRPTPLFLLSIITRCDCSSKAQITNRTILLFILWFWFATVFSMLFFLGILLVASRHVRKRQVLLLHPWGLLLLYFDVFVWLSLAVVLHVETENWPEIRPTFLERMEYPFVYFILIYVEIICFACLYYLYGTFFIAAELTVIEKFYT